MAGFMDFLLGNLDPMQANNNVPQQNNLLNSIPQMSIPTPGMNLGKASLNPTAIPSYAQAGGLAAAAQPAGMPGAQAPTAAPGVPGAQTQQDSMRKMMLMQYLMDGGEDPIQTPNGAMPSGSGMRGAGGAQTDPNAGLLNSMVGMQPRKRFLGQS